MEITDGPGTLSPFIDPDDQGRLRKVTDAGPLRDRCHTGRAFTATATGDAQPEAAEPRSPRAHPRRAATTIRSARNSASPDQDDDHGGAT